MQRTLGKWRAALRAAFPLTLPVLAGFLVLGLAYGMLMRAQGLGVFWTFLMSAAVFAGSMQYVAAPLLAASFDPLHAIALTLTVNARHLFYGLSMLERLRDTGRAKPYIIFAMCDETFSILSSVRPPAGVDKSAFMTCVAALNQAYWVAGSVLGAAAGAVLPINTKGLDFALTALFVVIFLNQWQARENRASALTGVACAALCVLLLGESFLLPAMALLLAVFYAAYRLEGRRAA